MDLLNEQPLSGMFFSFLHHLLNIIQYSFNFILITVRTGIDK
jgi:hypothetical protein